MTSLGYTIIGLLNKSLAGELMAVIVVLVSCTSMDKYSVALTASATLHFPSEPGSVARPVNSSVWNGCLSWKA